MGIEKRGALWSLGMDNLFSDDFHFVFLNLIAVYRS